MFVIIIIIIMSIIDHVSVAQGQALILMHCPRFIND